MLFKDKFKNLFRRIPSPKEVAGDVADKVKDGEDRLKKGFGDAVKKSGDAVKKGVGDAVDKMKHKKDDDSSTQATFEQEDYSTLKDPGVPLFRKWYMFAFIYPTIISFLLEWLRRGVQGG